MSYYSVIAYISEPQHIPSVYLHHEYDENLSALTQLPYCMSQNLLRVDVCMCGGEEPFLTKCHVAG